MVMNECDYCLKNYTHGGKCYNRLKNCMYYDKDPRGKDVHVRAEFQQPFDSSLKEIKVGMKINIESQNPDAEIKVIRIYGITWSYGKYGIDGVNIEMEVEGFENDLMIEMQEVKKSRFKVIK